MQQQEAWRSAFRRRVLGVERGDALLGVVEQGCVVGHRGLRSVGPVGQQCELRVRLAVGEPVQFEPVRELGVVRGRTQHRGHDDERAVPLGNAVREIEAWQGLHAHRLRHDALRQCNQRFGQRPREQQQRRDGGPVTAMRQAVQHGGQQQRGAEGDGPHVDGQAPAAMAARGACVRGACGLARRCVRLQRRDQRGPALAEEVVARGAIGAVGLRTGFVGRRAGRQRDHGLRHFALGPFGAACHLLHRMRDLLAREFALVRKARQFAQHAQRAAHRFDEVAPLDLADHAQGRDDVADREVGRGLRVLRVADQRRAVGAVLFGPAHQRGHVVAVLDGQALPQLREVAVLQAVALQCAVEHVEVLHREVRRCVPGRVRDLARDLVLGNALGHAAQVFEQHHAQGGGQRPQLAEHEFVDVLIGVEEGREQRLVEHAVGVRHIGPRNAVHARQPRQRRRDELGQACVVAARHAVMDLLELRLDEVEVVEQPFGCRRHIAPAQRDQRDVVEGGAQRLEVLVDTRKEGRAFARAVVFVFHHLGTGQAVAVLFETLGAEEFGANREGYRVVRTEQKGPGVVTEPLEAVDDGSGAQVTANRPMPNTTATQAIVTMRPAASARTRCMWLRSENHRPWARAQWRMWEARASKSLPTKSMCEWERDCGTDIATGSCETTSSCRAIARTVNVSRPYPFK
ncbi:hypothetical protein D9M68_539080 [compost metagenome]